MVLLRGGNSSKICTRGLSEANKEHYVEYWAQLVFYEVNAFIQICSHAFRLLHDASQRGKIYVTVAVTVDCEIPYVADRSLYAIGKFVLRDRTSSSLVYRSPTGALRQCYGLIPSKPYRHGPGATAGLPEQLRTGDSILRFEAKKNTQPSGQGGWQPNVA